MDLMSAKAISREIAKRVTEALLDDARNDPALNLPGIVRGDPFATLAFGQSVGAIDELAVSFHGRMLARFGTFIPPLFQQEVQLRDAAKEVQSRLRGRYARHLSGRAFDSGEVISPHLDRKIVPTSGES